MSARSSVRDLRLLACLAAAACSTTHKPEADPARVATVMKAIDQHTPGDQGPTFKRRTHVPAGETFTRNPQTGPQLQANPSNP